MISPPTLQGLQALSNLSRLPDWQEVDKLLAAELVATTERLIGCIEDAATRKLQGRAKMLRDLQDLAASAPDQLAKMRLNR